MGLQSLLIAAAVWGAVAVAPAAAAVRVITTTIPKAKEARRFAEKCITIGKRAAAATDPAQKLRFSRLAMTELHDLKAVKKLIAEVAPTYKDRKGGYTRVLRAGFRLGDHAPIAIFELV